jgi:hypothetical protein
MAKQKEKRYQPKEAEIEAMHLCNKNDLAYLIQPIKNKTKYNVIKFQISNYLDLHILKEKDIPLEFNEMDGMRKTMELYLLHSKRFKL